MGAFVRRQYRGLAALVALSLVLTVLAVLHRGVPAAQLNLNDGGVWVTHPAKRLVAHLNYPSRTLDGGLRASSREFDVTQSANTVLLHNSGTATVQPIDTALVSPAQGATLPETVTLHQGSRVAAAVDGTAGKVWTLPAAEVGLFSGQSQPTLEGVEGARVVVGLDDVVHVVSPDGRLRRITADGVKDDGRIEGLADLSTAALTVVGDTVVVLDKAASTLRTARGSVALDGAGTLELQLPGPERDTAVLAAADGYLLAPLGGGDSERQPVDGTGSPAAPAVVGSCAYLAWGRSGQYVRDCDNDADDRRQAVAAIRRSDRLVFRVNRDVVVLNDLVNGAVLLVNDSMQVVDNWTMIENQARQQEKEDDTRTDTTEDPDRDQPSKEKTAPVAEDDEFGVRPGGSALLPVLINDADADGDVLTASVGKPPTVGRVSRVRGGEALSLSVPDDASGVLSFEYTADDGRGGTDDAGVRVRVFGESDNKELPTERRRSAVTLGAGGEASYAVLGDWVDPQGDSLYLTGASGPGSLDVRHRPDGLITIKDLGTGGPGRREVRFEVSDGDRTAEGVLHVTVKGGENLPPVANADHVTAMRDQQVVVEPLRNDHDPDGDEVRLSTAPPGGAGQTIQPDYAAGSFVFSATTAGTYYVPYGITDGPSKAVEGRVRVDVADPADGEPPVAADDVALLAEGGSVMVDALANDSDPTGGVLVLQRVEVPDQARGLTVEVIDHGLLKLTSPAGLEGPTGFRYTVSNGAESDEGRVTVLPLTGEAASGTPVAADDKGIVRVGDIVTIPVLANDTSPSGLPLTLDPEVTVMGDAEAGDAFASRDAVRFRARTPGTVRLAYTVRDEQDNVDSAEVVVTVTALDAESAPPQPLPLTGRVLAGSTVSIPVPTDGIDPDGDSVTLVGLGEAPDLGTAAPEAGSLTYTAPEGVVGTDAFSYEVADRFGKRATATVRVGIAPPNATNQAPVAVPDEVATRPGRNLGLNPVANDTDPDGDPVVLVAQDALDPADETTRTPAVASGGSIELTAPDAEATLRYYYGATDGRGGTGRGIVSVQVRPDAVLRAPVARDDVVPPAEVTGRDAVEVDVLANDVDPDGTTADLQVQSGDPGVTVAGSKLRIEVGDQRQVVLYSVTDVDDQTSWAAVVVPPASAVAPYLLVDRIPARVKAGELLTLPLADYVGVRETRTPLLTFETKVKAGAGADQGPLVKDDRTLQFRSQPEFAGLSSLTFEVTDGDGRDDPDGLVSTLTIPIEVEAGTLHQPVFRPSEIRAGAGDDAPTTADLRQMTTDQDPGDLERLTFEVGAAPDGFEVSRDGSVLSVRADSATDPGTTGSLPVTVTDGSTDPVTGSLQLVATASGRPLMSITTAVVEDANAGQATQVDLTPHITNPFADRGEPVSLVGEPTTTSGDGTVTRSGLVLSITPAADFHGQLVVSYVAQDATGDPSRYVRGLVQLTVRARPERPSGVTAESHLSRTATVNWTAGANNGAPIERFTVRWSGGTKDCGQATTCTIDTLQNNVPYTFTVTATNAVGESGSSDPSNEVRPDVKPEPPGTPTGTFGDGSVALTWGASTTEGSPVSRYTVEISPAAGGVSQKDTTGTALTWSGLANGTSYTFRVQAHSAATEPSEWSGTSAPVVPAGPPAVPAAPKATKDPVSALAPSATVSWVAPDGNGDSNLTYELRRTGGSTVLCSGTNTSCNVTMSVETSDQTFEVRAQNKAGWSGWSSASNGIRGFQVPGAVGNLSVTPTGQDNTVRFSFDAADGNGATPSEMQYYWSAGGRTQSIAAGGGTVTDGAFADGQNVTVAVYARSTVNGESAQGASTSATVNAFGPPVSPSMSCEGGGTAISCSWSGGDANGRPTTFPLSGDHSAADGGATGGHNFGNVGYSTTRTLCVQAFQSGGAQGARNCDSKTTIPPPPPPSVSVSKGASAQGQPGCGSSYCYYVRATTANFTSGVTCTVNYAGGVSWTQGANEAIQSPNYYGYPGTVVVVTCNGVSGTLTW